ncbi:MAG: hypothetical protein Q9216_003894 [Gyalolechia sp. 2 TL-2023]
MSGLCLILIVIGLPETARKLVGNGSIRPTGVNRSLIDCMQKPEGKHTESKLIRPRFQAPNPFASLRIIFRRDTALILLTNAIFYVNYSCVQASLSTLFMDIYGLDALQVGLTYLPYGIACGIASFLHLAAPLILQFVCGLTVTGTFNVCNTLIVDLHPDRPATASAAVSITRCSAAAIGVSVLQFILDDIGPGWTFTLFGGLGASTAPLLWMEYRFGMQWRTERSEQKSRAVEERKERDPAVKG